MKVINKIWMYKQQSLQLLVGGMSVYVMQLESGAWFLIVMGWIWPTSAKVEQLVKK